MKTEQPQNLPKNGARTTGRPPKTSRDAIIAAAVAILEREPDAGVSLNRIAKEIDVTPMSLYNYFASRDELLQALTAYLMRDLELPQESNAAWQHKLMDWSHSVRAHFQRHPYLIRLIIWEGHTSIAWAQHWLYVIGVLEEAGLHDDELLLASSWLSRNVMSAINMEVLGQDNASQIEEDIRVLPEPEPTLSSMQRVRNFVNRVDYYDIDFQYMLERTLEVLALQISKATLQARTQTQSARKSNRK